MLLASAFTVINIKIYFVQKLLRDLLQLLVINDHEDNDWTNKIIYRISTKSDFVE